MAAAAHVSVNVYGLAIGNPPFQDSAGLAALTNIKPFPKPGVVSFPTTGTVFYPLANGIQVQNTVGTFYVYSVVEVQPTGLNVHGDKYLSDQSVATLATNAG